jgi:hypothetical protein
MAIRRRDFITVVGAGVGAWPLAARAQQPAMPVIGYLSTRAPDEAPHIVAAFRKGLNEAGFVEGQNVKIEFRWNALAIRSIGPERALHLLATKESRSRRSTTVY